MEVSELKKVLHQRIDELNDSEVLEAVNNFISNQDKVFKIPQKWREDISQGRKDIEEGNYYTLEDFQEKYKKWLED